jgi:internalin A
VLGVEGNPGVVVEFPDASLAAAVRASLDLAAGASITVGDLEDLTSLTAISSGISALTGLEYATNLTTLNLFVNSIADVSALSGLTSLTTLNLAANYITDVTPLTSLENLQSLELEGNPILDGSPLTALENLESVDIPLRPLEARMGDVNLRAAVREALGLEGSGRVTKLQMRELTTLNAQNRQISLLHSGFGYATNLTTLDLSHNSIELIGHLRTLTNLTTLHLNDNVIVDISYLSGLTQLTELHLENNNITDFSPLDG